MPTAVIIQRTATATSECRGPVVMTKVDIPAGKEMLTGMQLAIGGYIQRLDTIVFPSKHRADVWVNEDGLALYPVPTCYYTDKHGRTTDVYGPVLIICGAGKHKAGGLSDDDIAAITLVRSLDTLPTDLDMPECRIAKSKIKFPQGNFTLHRV